MNIGVCQYVSVYTSMQQKDTGKEEEKTSRKAGMTRKQGRNHQVCEILFCLFFFSVLLGPLSPKEGQGMQVKESSNRELN